MKLAGALFPGKVKGRHRQNDARHAQLVEGEPPWRNTPVSVAVTLAGSSQIETPASAGIAWSHDGGCRSRSGPARGRTGSPGSTEASRWDRTTIVTREAAMGGVKFKLVVDSPRPDASARLNAGAYSASWGIRGNCFLSPPLPWNHGWTRLQYTSMVGLNADGSSRPPARTIVRFGRTSH